MWPNRDRSQATQMRKPEIGGKLADAADLLDPAFGAALFERFPDRAASMPPRKRWELGWLAQQFEEINGDRRVESMLGLGVGAEPIIYHFTHVADRVVATDLYDPGGSWLEARLTHDQVFVANPFPYQRSHLTVRSMDMRSIDYPAESFDCVWSCSSVEHVSTLEEFIEVFREIHRVLKPGGYALITTEFSLDEPYFLPGVLSLWRGCALFHEALGGLTLAAPVDLSYHAEFAGNRATRRADVHRVALHNDLTGGPAGICVHVGHTRLIPLAFVLRKTDGSFQWPKQLNAPAWYGPFSVGFDSFRKKGGAGAASAPFRAALDLAEEAGARLHCFRYLIEAHVQAGEVEALRAAIRECAGEMPQLPDDDDALDLIAYVAASQGELEFAQRCWEKAAAGPSTLPGSKLRIRCNQLSAELKAHGATAEARHINALADAAWCEAVDFGGPDAPELRQFKNQLTRLRGENGLTSLVSSHGSMKATAEQAREPVTARNPYFDVMAPPDRPMVYVGNNLGLTKTVYGHKMYVDTASQIGACFLLDGYWEEWIIRRLKDYVKPGMRALDIGANMGFYTLLLCDLVGPEGHVTAFEPWPPYHEILRRNVEMNGYSGRCTLINKAVHEKTGNKPIAFDKNCGTGSLVGAEFLNGMSVETVSLDDYLAANPQEIDFIKFDVDGSEPFIFRGMNSILTSPRPMAAFCEFCSGLIRDAGVEPEHFLDQLLANRFKIFSIAPDGLKEIRTYDDVTDTHWMELLLLRDSG